jgi:hypothetical protein
MRWIDKSGPAPNALTSYISAQQALEPPVGLSYNDYPGRRDLRDALVAEQFGLCAFTGVPIDKRDSGPKLTTSSKKGQVGFSVHNAHLKPRCVCERELVAAGKSPGRDLGEDMDYKNIVAALEVKGTDSEKFGPSVAGEWWEPGNCVLPTHQNCETDLRYDDGGGIHGNNAAAVQTINKLKLGHGILSSWRREALRAFLDPANPSHHTATHLQAVVTAMSQPRTGRLPDYSFVIKNVAESLLELAAVSADSGLAES